MKKWLLSFLGVLWACCSGIVLIAPVYGQSRGCAVPQVAGQYTLTGNPSGLLVIDAQRGAHVTGRYGNDANSLVNAIEGDFGTGDQCHILRGTFANTQYHTSGIFQYTFSNAGTRFSGSWRHHDGQYSGTWDGTRQDAGQCTANGFKCDRDHECCSNKCAAPHGDSSVCQP